MEKPIKLPPLPHGHLASAPEDELNSDTKVTFVPSSDVCVSFGASIYTICIYIFYMCVLNMNICIYTYIYIFIYLFIYSFF